MPIIPFPLRVCDPSVSIMVNSEAILSTAHTVEEVMLRLADPVWSRLGYFSGRLWLQDLGTWRLQRVAQWQANLGIEPPSADDSAALLEKGQDLPGWAFERSRVEWMGQYAVSNGESRPEGRVCVPLQGDGIVIGVLELISADAGEPTTDRLVLLRQLGQWLGAFLLQMGV
jgi:hypothetical protein